MATIPRRHSFTEAVSIGRLPTPLRSPRLVASLLESPREGLLHAGHVRDGSGGDAGHLVAVAGPEWLRLRAGTWKLASDPMVANGVDPGRPIRVGSPDRLGDRPRESYPVASKLHPSVTHS